jgi:hypothetical protein
MSGQPNFDECVTIAQFSEMRQSMEERQDRLTQDLQALMVEIRRRRQPHDSACNHGDNEESEGVVARREREQGRRNRYGANGRGRGQGRRHNESDDSEDVDDNCHLQKPFVADLIEEVTKKRGWVN